MIRHLFLAIGFVLAAASSVAGAAGQGEWERTVQGAKKEGKVAVVSTVGSDIRKVLTEPFQAKYGITVDFSGLNGAEMAARLRRERDAGQYLLDVVVHGTTTALTTLKPMQALDPIEPSLILPEVKEPKNWLGGKLWFSDKARYNLIMGLTTRPAFAINSNLVKAEEFKSFRDLLNPKWKGKIIVGRDPAIAGPGQAIFTHFFLHKDLGPDFIRAITKQDLTILRDDRQGLDWVAQGKFLILLGPAETISEEMMRRGVPIALIPPQQLREGGDLSPGPASLVLINRAPRPNAARVYINWLLSKEGQTEYSRGIGIPSLRLDVPTDHLVPWRRPVPSYIETYTEEALESKEPLLRLLKEVLAK